MNRKPIQSPAELAAEYFTEYLVHVFEEHNFWALLDDPLRRDENNLLEGWGELGIEMLYGMPLRSHLQIDDITFNSMVVAWENNWKKIRSISEDKNGWNRRYEHAASQMRMALDHSGTREIFSALSSCQDCGEVDLLYMHPKAGPCKRINADEYRIRSAPYVAAFRTELRPGDLEAGLVLDPSQLGLAWTRVHGHVGSGKSTMLRQQVSVAARDGRTVIALQLQPDRSAGFVATGAQEVFTVEEFKDLVERLPRQETRPLLIIDGIGLTDAEKLEDWAQKAIMDGTVELICATNRVDDVLFPKWGEPQTTVRLDRLS
ncbi:ATP-binding protein [Lysinibacter cavernae]|uniref:ATP-binding protein n=1 Tax=Lysinibacter cavernae TaxID=1640652 RepID=UPI00360F6399